MADIRPEKVDPNQVRFTIRGDILECTGPTSTETSSIETAKLLINSTLSTKGACFAAMDISNFYIHNDLEDYQYMRFTMKMIPQEIINEYNLEEIVHDDGYCHVEVRKSLYGLREAGYIANVELKRIQGLEGYIPLKCTPGLFTHKTRDIAFSRVVDDFGVRYTKREDAEYLLKLYKINIQSK